MQNADQFETLNEIRHAYTQKIIRYCAVIFLPVLLYASYMAVQREITYIIPTYVVIYAAVLMLAIDRPKVSPKAKGILLTGLPLMVCSYEFLLFGLSGSGTIYLPLLVFLGIATLSNRAALGSLAVGILLMGIAGYIILNNPGFLPPERVNTSFRIESWIIRGVELIALCGIMVTGMQYIFNRMSTALEDAQRLSTTVAEKQEHLEKIMRSVPGAVMMVALDGVGTVQWSNKAAASMFGSTADHLQDATLRDLLKHACEYPQLQHTLLAEQHFAGSEMLFCGPFEDRTFWGQISGSLVDSGEKPAALLVLLDVDERTRSKQALIQAQKMESLGLMAGGIAHDFRNVLTTVKAHTSIAMRAIDADHKAHSQLEKAQNAVDTATDLTAQLLAYASQDTPEIDELDINALITDIDDLLSVSVPSNVEVHRKLCNEAPAVLGDKNQMQQVILNLIINAAEAIGPRAGNILISTDEIELETLQARKWQIGNDELQGGRYLLLEVADSGSGMDTATLHSIFDPFFTTKETGTGLGLATVFGIIRAHAGGIQVVSRQGRGTAFRIIFPVVETPILQPIAELI